MFKNKHQEPASCTKILLCRGDLGKSGEISGAGHLRKIVTSGTDFSMILRVFEFSELYTENSKRLYENMKVLKQMKCKSKIIT